MAAAKQTDVKELLISINSGVKAPSYSFKGNWTGFEVSTVIRNLRRAYLLRARSIRRNAVSETSSNSTKEETK